MKSRNQGNDTKYDFNKRNEHSSLISPCIEPLYKFILDPLIIRYRLNLSNKFWYSLGFGIFSLLIFIFGISFSVPALFFLLTALFFVSENRELVKGKLLPKKTDITTKFVSDINNLQISEVQRFLREYRYYLTTEELKSIIQSRHKTNPSFHETITRFQNISGELVEYIVKIQLFVDQNPDILIKYLKRATDCISLESYIEIRNYYSGNKNVIKVLNTCFPLFLEGHNFFSILAKLRVRIRDGFNYGNLDGFLVLIALILSIYGFISNVSSNRIDYTPGDFFSLLSFAFSIIIVAMIFYIIFKYIIKFLLFLYREFLVIIAPWREFNLILKFKQLFSR